MPADTPVRKTIHRLRYRKAVASERQPVFLRQEAQSRGPVGGFPLHGCPPLLITQSLGGFGSCWGVSQISCCWTFGSLVVEGLPLWRKSRSDNPTSSPWRSQCRRTRKTSADCSKPESTGPSSGNYPVELHGAMVFCPSRRRKTARNDEYLCGLRRVRIPRSNGISPGTRPIAITSRSGLSSRKRRFEPGRNCHRSLLLWQGFCDWRLVRPARPSIICPSPADPVPVACGGSDAILVMSQVRRPRMC